MRKGTDDCRGPRLVVAVAGELTDHITQPERRDPVESSPRSTLHATTEAAPEPRLSGVDIPPTRIGMGYPPSDRPTTIDACLDASVPIVLAPAAFSHSVVAPTGRPRKGTRPARTA